MLQQWQTIALLCTDSHSLSVEQEKWDNTQLKSPACSVCSAPIKDIEHVLPQTPFLWPYKIEVQHIYIVYGIHIDSIYIYGIRGSHSTYCVNTWWQLHLSSFHVCSYPEIWTWMYEKQSLPCVPSMSQPWLEETVELIDCLIGQWHFGSTYVTLPRS